MSELVLVAMQGGDTRRPTADDLVAWLQARPDLAVEVVGRLRVAGPWEPPGYRYSVGRGNPLAWASRDWRSPQDYATGAPERYICGAPEGDSSKGGLPGKYRTADEARAAADAALVAAGWSLAGGAR